MASWRIHHDIVVRWSYEKYSLNQLWTNTGHPSSIPVQLPQTPGDVIYVNVQPLDRCLGKRFFAFFPLSLYQIINYLKFLFEFWDINIFHVELVHSQYISFDHTCRQYFAGKVDNLTRGFEGSHTDPGSIAVSIQVGIFIYVGW